MELDLSVPMIGALKAQAKALRASDTNLKSHADALECVAHDAGARDWNTLVARLRKPVRLSPGMRVAGHYLGQAFEGRVHAVSLLAGDAQMRVTLQFDEAVDVVTFDSFSSMRSRVTSVIGPDGRSLRATSDGAPHLILEQVSS